MRFMIPGLCNHYWTAPYEGMDEVHECLLQPGHSGSHKCGCGLTIDNNEGDDND